MKKVGLQVLIFLKTKIYTCNGGEQQRIAIARAILEFEINYCGRTYR